MKALTWRTPLFFWAYDDTFHPRSGQGQEKVANVPVWQIPDGAGGDVKLIVHIGLRRCCECVNSNDVSPCEKPLERMVR